MGWVTLDDGQHVFIGSSGRVLATRSQISSGPGGGKERGRALAQRSKAAIGKATGKGGKATGFHKGESIEYTGKTQQIAGGTFHEFKYTSGAKAGQTGVTQRAPGKTDPYAAKAQATNKEMQEGFKRLRESGQSDQMPKQSPATTRAIEHAKAAGDDQFKLIQRSAVGHKAAVNTGKGVTKFMFDMKRGDKRGQTSFLK